MFDAPLYGAANVFGDNESLYKNTVIPESTLINKHHSTAYHRCREAVSEKVIRISKQEKSKILMTCSQKF